jgi:guanylate kinase
LVCLVGPAGGGKTTLAERLIGEEQGSITKSISVTSRPQRPNEVPGKSYHFVSRDEFNTRVQKGLFFEWEEIHGNLYGTLRDSLESAIREGQDLLFDIDIRGARSLEAAFPDSVVIVFIVPPSFSLVTERIRARGDVSTEELNRRLETAREEYRMMYQAFSYGGADGVGMAAGGNRKSPGGEYLVVNDTIEYAQSALRSIVSAERVRLQRQNRTAVERLFSIDVPAS